MCNIVKLLNGICQKDFVWWNKHETDFHKVCACKFSARSRNSIACNSAEIFKEGLKVTQTFFWELLLVTKAEIMGTIQKPGKSPLSPSPKKGWQAKSIHICFFILKELSIRCLFLLVCPSMHCSTAMSSGRWGRIWKENVQKNWCTGNWFLQQDNAGPNTAFNMHEFLAKNKMTAVPHQLCSSHLVLCDFILFPKMKINTKLQIFDSVEGIQVESQVVLNNLTKKNF